MHVFTMAASRWDERNPDKTAILHLIQKNRSGCDKLMRLKACRSKSTSDRAPPSRPTLTMRPSTERPVTVEVGTNLVLGNDTRRLEREVDR